MRRHPVIERHVRARIQMGTLRWRRARADPANKALAIPLPYRMEYSRPRPALCIDCRRAAPDNSMGHLDKRRSNFSKTIHRSDRYTTMIMKSRPLTRALGYFEHERVQSS